MYPSKRFCLQHPVTVNPLIRLRVLYVALHKPRDRSEKCITLTISVKRGLDFGAIHRKGNSAKAGTPTEGPGILSLESLCCVATSSS